MLPDSFMGHEHLDLASEVALVARSALEYRPAECFPAAYVERKQLLEGKERAGGSPGAQLHTQQVSSCPDIIKR